MADDISVTPVTPLPRNGDQQHSAPRPCPESWRCNLTALSHTENLYFVAIRNHIFVHQPRFPDQSLDPEPSLILQPSGPEPAQWNVPALPSLDHGRSINHLIVDFLGNEEILLLALHHGGVIGYRVSQIQRAIEKRQEPNCIETNMGDDVTPFFKEHVSKSAWGLAIHREARMIAVSSNTHKVTVFAFALDRRDAPSSELWYLDRSEQKRVELPDTGTNIPCVAFCNTADDPEGRWLLTTDIDGVARVFDLALVGSDVDPCVHMTAPRFCVETVRDGEVLCACQSLNDIHSHLAHATWGALWLDSCAFKRVDNLKDAFGCEAKVTKSEQTDQVSFDCSSRRSLVPNSSTTWELDPSMPPEEPVDGVWDGTRKCWRKLTNELEPDAPSDDDLPSTSPILLLSIRDMILLQPLRQGIEPDQVAFHDPLFRVFKKSADPLRLRDQDRFNLYAQIPELGVAIVGSAKGQVAVLSLTQTRSTRPGGRTYACRIDHILPTREQERKGERPFGFLAGIAVGPVQGMMGRAANHARRWRLLMMFFDTMLAYEISKRAEGASRGPDVSAELII